jgi:hypothetical protein
MADLKHLLHWSDSRQQLFILALAGCAAVTAAAPAFPLLAPDAGPPAAVPSSTLRAAPAEIDLRAKRWLPVLPFETPAATFILLDERPPNSPPRIVRFTVQQPAAGGAAGAANNLRVPVRITGPKKVGGSQEEISELEAVELPPNTPVTFTIQPGTAEDAGVYANTCTFRADGSTDEASVHVKVVATDGPWVALLFVLAGVAVATYLVLWRNLNRQKTILLLRAAGLMRRLKTMTGVVLDRSRDALWQIQSLWQEQDLERAGTRLTELEATLDAQDEAFAVVQTTERLLAPGPEPSDDRQPAGRLLLDNARAALQCGDAAGAKGFAANARKVHGEALGFYQRLHAHDVALRHLLAGHQQELSKVEPALRLALRWTAERIDDLALVKETINTEEAEQGLLRIGYWRRTLEVIADALTAISLSSPTARPRVMAALDRLARLGAEDILAPRPKDHADALQKAEDDARSAVRLYEAEPYLADVGLWLSADDGSKAWPLYQEARQEAEKPDGDADKALAAALQAAARLRLAELERVAWRWPDQDARWVSLSAGRRAVALASWGEAVRALPWKEDSYPELPEALADEISLIAECGGPGEHEGKQAEEADPAQALSILLGARARPAVQELLALYYQFELSLAARQTGQDGTDEMQAAQTRLAEHKPFAAVGAFRRALDWIPVQEAVARALLREVERISSRDGDAGWEERAAARDDLDHSRWAAALGKAREAWGAVRKPLTEYYLKRIGEVVRDKAHPGFEELQQAQQALAAGCLTQAAIRARAAWHLAKPAVARDVVAKAWPGDDARKQEAETRIAEGKVEEVIHEAELVLAPAVAPPAPRVRPKVPRGGRKRFGRPPSRASDTAAVEAAERSSAEEAAENELKQWSEELKGRAGGVLFDETFKTATHSLETGGLWHEALAEAKNVRDYLTQRPESTELLQALPERLLKLGPAEGAAGRAVESGRTAIRSGEWGEADAALLTARRYDLRRRLRKANVPDSWTKPYLNDRLAAAKEQAAPADLIAALQKAEEVIHFLEEHRGDIRQAEERIVAVPDDGGNVDRINAREALAQRGDVAAAKASLDSAQVATTVWEKEIPKGVFELVRTNTGMKLDEKPKRNYGRWLGFFVALVIGAITGGGAGLWFSSWGSGVATGFVVWLIAWGVSEWLLLLVNTPNLDDETSVDDRFHFKAQVAAGQQADPTRYRFEWYHLGQGGGRIVQGSEPGKVGDEVEDTFTTPGWKRVRVEIRHREVPSRRCTVDGYVDVKPSRYSMARRLLEVNTLLETAVVVALASLVGFSAKYFTNSLGTFGTFADYLGAFLCGATAKYGEEGVKSVANVLSRAARSAPAANPAKEAKE